MKIKKIGTKAGRKLAEMQDVARPKRNVLIMPFFRLIILKRNGEIIFLGKT